MKEIGKQARCENFLLGSGLQSLWCKVGIYCKIIVIWLEFHSKTVALPINYYANCFQMWLKNVFTKKWFFF